MYLLPIIFPVRISICYYTVNTFIYLLNCTHSQAVQLYKNGKPRVHAANERLKQQTFLLIFFEYLFFSFFYFYYIFFALFTLISFFFNYLHFFICFAIPSFPSAPIII